MAPIACDILIKNACVLSMDAKRTIYRPGAVAITGRNILMAGPERDILPAVAPIRVIDAGGAVVHPGFVEAHYHTTMHLTRASITDDPKRPAVGKSGADGRAAKPIYAEWVDAMTDEDEHASALLACLEMARNGYTCFMDPGTVLEPDTAATAAEAVGIRGSLADPYLSDSLGGTQLAALDRAPPSLERSLKLMGNELRRNKDPNALIGGHVAVYGSGSASDTLMLAAKKCADDNSVIYTQHQSFLPQAVETEDKRLGKHALVHFEEIGVLGPNVSFVHMNILRDDEVNAIVRSGMSVIWHPGNFFFYGIGESARQRMLELRARGTNLGLGSDLCKLWTFGELPYIAYLASRTQGGYISPGSLLEIATLGGARAMGWQDRIGSLEPGKRADLVIRRNDLPEACPGTDPVFETVLVARSKSVDTVICDGQIIVKGGHSTRLDERVIYLSACASARRLMAKTGLKGDLDWPIVAGDMDWEFIGG
ncbi:amidohydrolase family protein [Bradyrhizobium sp. CW1]|uniref:amidohydrolase family protein n=1 Tax=Bradyrhizobium sp. CW1 TaxID=2782686 RepID=UPI001FFE9BA2|nr:amidohydrolase family protein [Bradyrhizobium sp. CW1]UPJ26407.1 amidohydrolase family protein [Bradyrhizobium sp. CW1]